MVELEGFVIKAGNYEGPLELLLDLIEKRKLLVNEVSLAQVTDDFITHVKNASTFSMEMVTDFISVAATLLLIKSRSLLPDIELTAEEETEVFDLEERLAQYEKVRTAARELSLLFGSAPLYEPGIRAPEIYFSPGPSLTKESISAAFISATTRDTTEEKLPEVRVRAVISIEEIMDTLQKRVARTLSLSFKEFTGTAKEKVDIIVSFLALLELVKQGTVEAEQGASYGDIQITNREASMPRYV